MFGFGMPEMVIIGVILLVMFGPAKIPQLGSSLGSAIRNFRQASVEESKSINLDDKKDA